MMNLHQKLISLKQKENENMGDRMKRTRKRRHKIQQYENRERIKNI